MRLYGASRSLQCARMLRAVSAVGSCPATTITNTLGTAKRCWREMMHTGRRIAADEGQSLGLSNELVETGAAEPRARALAVQIAGNDPLTNQLILTALPRIGDMSRSDGFWAEALTTAVSQSTADADEGLRAFLEKRPPDFHGE